MNWRAPTSTAIKGLIGIGSGALPGGHSAVFRPAAIALILMQVTLSLGCVSEGWESVRFHLEVGGLSSGLEAGGFEYRATWLEDSGEAILAAADPDMAGLQRVDLLLAEGTYSGRDEFWRSGALDRQGRAEFWFEGRFRPRPVPLLNPAYYADLIAGVRSPEGLWIELCPTSRTGDAVADETGDWPRWFVVVRRDSELVVVAVRGRGRGPAGAGGGDGVVGRVERALMGVPAPSDATTWRVQIDCGESR